MTLSHSNTEERFHFKVAGLFSSTEPWHHAVRTNPDYELLIGVKHTLYLTFDDREIALKPGDILIIPPGLRFKGTRDSLPMLSFYWIHFTMTIDAADNSSFFSIIHHHPKDPFYSNTFPTTKIVTLVDHLIETMKSTWHSQHLLDSLTTSILLTISGITNQRTSDKDNNVNYLVLYIIDWLNHHYMQPFSVEEAANYFGYNTAYFSHFFAKNTNKTLTSYVNDLRINHAKKALRSGTKSIKEIAYECGYQDEKYFSRIFRKLEGVSPSFYRGTANTQNANYEKET
ncbi:AraC family transcriptional regulator [Niallia sp.]|uniref:helix-turn-helix transcriptional regulator n=1 Tax=Niallia sp. TaxID=2837523 RepID=UPI00289A81DF|nr:AraC family transcriptional regulator [Niallia sp.]